MNDHDDILRLDDFRGVLNYSPSREWSIAHGSRLEQDEPNRSTIVLLHAGQTIGILDIGERISETSICDTGHFALSIYRDGDNAGTFMYFYQPNGTQYTNIFAPGYLSFFRLLDYGKQILFSYSDKVLLLDVKPVWTQISFDLPSRFYPLDGYTENDFVCLSDHTGGPYRFSKTGEFLDYGPWFTSFANQADGDVLFLTIRDLCSSAKEWSEENYANAAAWIEEAIRRGIKDSFHVKVADAYLTLAWLKNMCGDLNGAAEARVLQELNEDGFRAVDSIAEQINDLCSSEDISQIQHALKRLERASAYDRISEYPNYYGKIFRFKGELLFKLGNLGGAEKAFIRALSINPRVGCKKQLDKIQKNKKC